MNLRFKIMSGMLLWKISARRSVGGDKRDRTADLLNAIPGASIEDIEYLPDRKPDKSQILRLESCTYIQEAHNVILLGATGAGKTYLACALGMAANRNFTNWAVGDFSLTNIGHFFPT